MLIKGGENERFREFMSGDPGEYVDFAFFVKNRKNK
jgi:hypothetical protein